MSPKCSCCEAGGKPWGRAERGCRLASWLCQALWAHGDAEAGDTEGGQEASAEKELLELELEGQGDCHVAGWRRLSQTEGVAEMKALKSSVAKACSGDKGQSGFLAPELETLLVEGTLPSDLQTEKLCGPTTHTRSCRGTHQRPGVLLAGWSPSSGRCPNLSETEFLTAAPNVAPTPHHHTFGVRDLGIRVNRSQQALCKVNFVTPEAF